MVVAFSFNIGICHQEHRQDESNDVPAGENESKAKSQYYESTMILG